jgi:hypothetical protein
MGEERKRRREKLVKDSVKNDIVLREYDNIVEWHFTWEGGKFSHHRKVVFNH